jgi:hypothetical protein
MKLSNKGVTLVEVLLATMILTGALSGLLVLFMNCVMLNDSSRNLTVAVSHAQYVMEDIKFAGRTGLGPIRAGITSGTTWSWDSNRIAQERLIYQERFLQTLPGETIVASCPLNPTCSGDLINVTVKVKWWEGKRRDRWTQLTTNFINPGP